VVLDKLRGRLEGVSLRLGRSASRILPSPTAWTVIGTLFSFLAAAFFATGRYGGELSGGIFVLVSGLFDVLDGSVARATNRVSKRGAFLDSTLDRVGETSIYLGILVGVFTSPVIVFLALSSSLLVSYSRAKADALSINLAGFGIGERSERLAVLFFASLIGFVQYGLVIVAVLALVTFVARVARVTASLGGKPAPPAS